MNCHRRKLLGEEEAREKYSFCPDEPREEGPQKRGERRLSNTLAKIKVDLEEGILVKKKNVK